MLLRLILCIMSAMVGAGFASGREILWFFSRYGSFSWGLIALAGGGMAWLIDRAMAFPSLQALLPGGLWKKPGQGALLLMLLCTAGAMAAAAGELAALIIPLRYARGLGMAVAIAGCLALSDRCVAALGWIGGALLPVLILALLLCLRIPGEALPAEVPGWKSIPGAITQAACYAGLNVLLSAGVLCEAGKRCAPSQRKWAAIGAGALIALLLALGNAALLPHLRALRDQPLPFVQLLRGYGKTGFYLAAAVLYLAVVTTLIAVCRGALAGMEGWRGRHKKISVGLIAALIGLSGFENIVATVYPALGLVSLLLFLLAGRERRFNRRGRRRPPSRPCAEFRRSHSRRPAGLR
ncbi:MAG: hypothetical protein IJ662_04080 [Clostridia bacterium]|nr:hypothetical protein [Clostridia bacterium]